MNRPSVLQRLRLSPAVLAWLLVAALVRGFLPPGVMPSMDGGVPSLTLCAADGGAALLGAAAKIGAAQQGSDHLCPYALAAAAGLPSSSSAEQGAWTAKHESARADDVRAARGRRVLQVRARGPPTLG